MNRQEAIEVLKERIDAIEDDQAYSQMSKSMYKDGYRRMDAYRLAIKALSSPTPDPITGLVPCDFCTNTFERKPLLQENKYKPYTRMMSTISIEENNGKHHIEIDLWDGGNVYAAFGINYCPMCGRKLDVEG